MGIIMMTKTKKIILYCLPFAGGNSYLYRSFKKHFYDFIEMIPIELPGRGRRSHEPLSTHLETLAEDVSHQIQQRGKYPLYAIFGHSMGASLSYLTSHQLLLKNFPLPQHLFLSGRQAPSVLKQENPRYNLPKKEFFMMLNKLEGCPKELLKNETLINLFEPILRVDFKAVETWNDQDLPPLDIPMTILLGTDDKEMNEAEALAWRKETLHPMTIKRFLGGHFFIFDHIPKVCQSISETLYPLLQRSDDPLLQE